MDSTDIRVQNIYMPSVYNCIPVHNVRVLVFAHNCDIQTYLLAKKLKRQS